MLVAMNTRLLLPLSFLALVAVAIARTSAQEGPRVLDGAMHHLGNDPAPEWKEASVEPEGTGLEFDFQAEAGEATLLVAQRNVNDPWHIRINGERVATLRTGEELLDRFYPVPDGVLVDGTNRFELVGDVPTDDITFGNVRLYRGSFREIFDLRVVTVRVANGTTGEPSPARVTIARAGTDELAELYYAEKLTTAVRKGVCYTSNGEATFELPPGDYDVWATRGTEWSLGHARLTVDGAEHLVPLELVREVDTTGYVACDTHVHTLTFSGHGDSSVEERMVTLAGEGVELAISTDHNHNTDYRPYQERMGLNEYFTPVVGNEVSTPVGHFNAFPLDPEDEVPPHDLRDIDVIVSGIREKGAQVVILNHPRWPEHDTGPFGEFRLDHFTGESDMPHPYDAMELINSQTEEREPMLLFKDWFALMNRGEHVRAVASSDSHTVGGVVGMGRTYIRSSTDDPAAIDVDEACRNVVEGRSTISMGLYNEILVDGAHGPGDVVRVGADGRVAVELRIACASWIRPGTAVLYVDGVPAWESRLPVGEGPTDLRLEVDLDVPSHDAWVVCVVTGPGIGGVYWPQLNDYTLAATNPVFLDGDGDGGWSSPRAVARKLLDEAGSDPESLGRLLETCDEAVGLHALWFAREDYLRQADERLRGAAREAASTNERLRAYLETLQQD